MLFRHAADDAVSRYDDACRSLRHAYMPPLIDAATPLRRFYFDGHAAIIDIDISLMLAAIMPPYITRIALILLMIAADAIDAAAFSLLDVHTIRVTSYVVIRHTPLIVC